MQSRNLDSDVLLKLLRLSLGNSTDTAMPTSVNWQEVMALAERQGVLGVAFDGIQKLPKDQLPDIDTLMDWLGQTEYMRTVYEQYEDTICCLSRSLSEAGLRPVVMKGYGCSLNYPNPEMRPCGDIDIFLLDANGKCDFDRGNRKIKEKLQVEVDPHSNHHSTFQYKGFTVENHQTVLDVISHKSSIYLNNLLEELALDYRTVNIKGQEIYIPSAKFNSIHLLRHMASDFATFTTSLRHVLDWSTFVASHNLDWAFVHEVVHKNSMNKFLDAVNGICVEYLGYSEELFPIEKKDIHLRDKVMGDILFNTDRPDVPPSQMSFAEKLSYGWFKTYRMWRNRWKYGIVYDESFIRTFFSLAINRLK